MTRARGWHFKATFQRALCSDGTAAWGCFTLTGSIHFFFESVHMLQPSERIKSSILWHEPDNAREAETGPLAVTNNRAVVLGRTMEAAS